jgi:hypothetical protein
VLIGGVAAKAVNTKDDAKKVNPGYAFYISPISGISNLFVDDYTRMLSGFTQAAPSYDITINIYKNGSEY